jgi:hypothetical protein
MNYYKILSNPPKNGTLIDTNKSWDNLRFDRFLKLNKLFKLIFEVSCEGKLPLLNILAELYPEQFISDITVKNFSKYEVELKIIKKEIVETNFNVELEFRYFTDYVLSEKRKELGEKSNLKIPDRFKSHYFFESIEDCLNYHDNLITTKECVIVLVEIIDQISLCKMDNTYLTSFQNHHTAEDFYKHAEDFLMQKTSENPLFEVVFQGK